jgi:hypothetical protein
MPPNLVMAHKIIVARWRLVTYRNTTAWSSPRPPSRAQALPASSSASPIALPAFPPSGPLVALVYVLRHISAWEESRDTGWET